MNLEALACGTPVFALRDGGIPEIVNETSGFICNKPEEMVDAISKIDSISSRACRERAEWFSIDRCSDRYEQLYQTILDGQEW
jgi:glycosyltransferase involved in cell wall biosynthesis